MREEITHIGIIFNEQVSRSFFWLRGNAQNPGMVVTVIRMTMYGVKTAVC